MYCYGLDAHSDVIKVYRKDLKTGEGKYLTVNIHNDTFQKFRQILTHEDYIALECSTNSFFLYDELNPYVKQTFVLNPRKLRDIANANVKTDKRDAKRIADRLSYALSQLKAERELPLVYVPEPKVREIRSLFSTHTSLKKKVVSVKNHIHALVKQNGHLIGKSILEKKGSKELILNMDMPTTVKIQVQIYYRLLDQLNTELSVLEKTILKAGKIFKQEIKIITSIKGISVMGAIAIMSDIVTIDRFQNAKHLCSYLRTAPGIQASNKTVHVTRVNKSSRTLSLNWLLQAVAHFRVGSEKIEEFHWRKSQAKKHSGKVRIAIVRKVMVAIFNMLKNGELYYYTQKDNHEQKIKNYEKFLLKHA